VSVLEKVAVMTTKANVLRVANILFAANENGSVNIKQSEIAAKLQTNKQEVSKAVKELISMGIVNAEKNGTRYTYYINNN